MPRFASFNTLLKKLAFSPDGAILFHSMPHRISVWDMGSMQLRGVVEGELFGIADDGKTFISRIIDPQWIARDIRALCGAGRQSFLTDSFPTPHFMIWNTASCTSLKFTQISPDLYPLHQRLHVVADRYEHVVRLDDVFQVIPSRTINLQAATSQDGFLENWVIAPDNQHLAVIHFISAGGFDWEGGVCVRLNDGKKVYEFKGGRDDFPPYLYFSHEHRWLISPHNSETNIYDLATGEHLNKLKSNASVVSAHMTEMLVAEVNHARSNVCLLHLHNMNQTSEAIWNAVSTSEILDVEFHPDGNRLAVALKNGKVELRTVKTGEILNTLSVPDLS